MNKQMEKISNEDAERPWSIDEMYEIAKEDAHRFFPDNPRGAELYTKGVMGSITKEELKELMGELARLGKELVKSCLENKPKEEK